MPAGLISIDIEARLAKLEEGVKRTNAGLDSIGRTAERVSGVAQSAFRGMVAGIASALTVGTITSWAKEVIAGAEALQDLSDSTGSTVEALSRLNNITKIGGGNFEDIKGALERLAAGMAGVEEGGSKTADALRFLNIQAKDPAKALEEIAVKLDKFRDGANKAAIAKDLFGRAGVGFLATLKDIANNGDVAATVTAKQAAEATKLAEEMRRLSVESTRAANALLSDVVPALNELISKFNAARAAGVGFFDALGAIAGVAGRDGSTADKIAQVTAELEKAKAAASRDFGPFTGLKQLNDLINPSKVASLTAQLAILQKQALAESQSKFHRSGIDPFPKPVLGYTGASGAAGDKISEAQRYLEGLQRQIDKIVELSARETALAEIQKGRLKGLTPALRDQILAVADQIDAYKALEEEIKTSAKAFEDEQKAAQQVVDERARATKAALDEAAQIAESNERLRDEIAIILGGESARKAIEKQYVANAIAAKEYALAQIEINDATRGMREALEIQIEQLKERKELLEGKDTAEAIKAQAEAMKQLADQFNNVGSSSFAQFLRDLTTGKPLDALKNLGNNLFTGINQIVTDRFANSLFGEGGAANGFGGFLASLFGGQGGGAASLAGAGATLTASGTVLTGAGTLLTTAAASLTAAATAMAASSAASSAGSIFSAFTGPAFGTAANGSDFTSGAPYITGERGRELVVPPRGSQIIPNHQLGALGSTVNIHMNVYGGNTQTARHAARMLADRASFARRRG
jgi:hypothetical protein